MSDVKLVLVCFICTTFIVSVFVIGSREITEDIQERKARDTKLLELLNRTSALNEELEQFARELRVKELIK